MPHLAGVATAVQLLQRMPGLPILFTSGFSENSNDAVAQVPGSHYLQKPYGPTSLAIIIQGILDRESLVCTRQHRPDRNQASTFFD